MSLSPSFPHGAPSLAEVLLQRTFATPPKPFVDGEFLRALEHADDAPATAAVARPSAIDAHTPGDAAPGSPDQPGPGKTVDVRV